jgi:hypothetical protein
LAFLQAIGFAFSFHPEILSIAPPRIILFQFIAWVSNPVVAHVPALIESLMTVLDSDCEFHAIRAIEFIFYASFFAAPAATFSVVFPVFCRFVAIFPRHSMVIERMVIAGIKALQAEMRQNQKGESRELDEYLMFLVKFGTKHAREFAGTTINDCLFALSEEISKLNSIALEVMAVLAPFAVPDTVVSLALLLWMPLRKFLVTCPTSLEICDGSGNAIPLNELFNGFELC